MIQIDEIKQLILQSLVNVKQSEKVYQALAINDKTIVLGEGSPFDSIAFTNFAVSLEEKIEDAIGREFILRLEDIYEIDVPVTVDALALALASVLNSKNTNAKL